MLKSSSFLIVTSLFLLIVFLGIINKKFTTEMKITLSICPVLMALGFIIE